MLGVENGTDVEPTQVDGAGDVEDMVAFALEMNTSSTGDGPQTKRHKVVNNVGKSSGNLTIPKRTRLVNSTSHLRDGKRRSKTNVE